MKFLRIRVGVIGLLCLFTLALTACADVNDQAIQGVWAFANEGDDYRSGSLHVVNEWTFQGGTFDYYFEVALGSPLTLYGYYRIIESGENYLHIELYDLDGTQASGYTDRRGNLYLEIFPETGELRINGDLFERVR